MFDHLRLLLLALVDVVGMVGYNHWLLGSKAVPLLCMCRTCSAARGVEQHMLHSTFGGAINI
jgi:hypothetical protein